MRNLLTRVPKSAQRFVATIVRSIFAQPDAESVHELHARIVGQLGGRFPAAAALLEEAGPEILAFTSFPKEHGTQLRRFQDGIIGEAIYQKPVAERVGCTFRSSCKSPRFPCAAEFCDRIATSHRRRSRRMLDGQTGVESSA